jgi:hypothetical protein
LLNLTGPTSGIEPAPGERIAIFGVKPDIIQSTPNFGRGFYPFRYTFFIRATHQIPCTNIRKNKMLAGSFKQVAGETDLAPPPQKMPCLSVLPKSKLVEPILFIRRSILGVQNL